MTKQPRKLSLPPIDPGWATVIAAALAALATILGYILTRDSAPSEGPNPSVVAASITPSPSASTIVAVTPVPQVVSQLPAAQKVIVQNASDALVQAAQALPLMIQDDFEDNDYGWPIEKNIYNGGITCDTAIANNAFRINVQSKQGSAYCTAGPPQSAADFIVSVDHQLEHGRNADLILYYRAVDDDYFYIVINPQTQSLAVGVVVDAQDHPIIASTFVEEIHATGPNRISLLAVENSHALYINDKLIALYTDDRIRAGQIRLGVRLLEANQEETLLTEHFQLRGN